MHLISDSKQMNKQNQMCNKMPNMRTDWKLKKTLSNNDHRKIFVEREEGRKKQNDNCQQGGN